MVHSKLRGGSCSRSVFPKHTALWQLYSRLTLSPAVLTPRRNASPTGLRNSLAQQVPSPGRRDFHVQGNSSAQSTYAECVLRH